MARSQSSETATCRSPTTPLLVAPPPPPPPPRATFRLVVAPLRGPGQSPVLPFACCVGSLRSVGRCGRCSCWCRFRVRGAQWLVCPGCAGCGGMCRLRVSGAQWLVCWGCAGCGGMCRLRVSGAQWLVCRGCAGCGAPQTSQEVLQSGSGAQCSRREGVVWKGGLGGRGG